MAIILNQLFSRAALCSGAKVERLRPEQGEAALAAAGCDAAETQALLALPDFSRWEREARLALALENPCSNPGVSTYHPGKDVGELPFAKPGVLVPESKAQERSADVSPIVYTGPTVGAFVRVVEPDPGFELYLCSPGLLLSSAASRRDLAGTAVVAAWLLGTYVPAIESWGGFVETERAVANVHDLEAFCSLLPEGPARERAEQAIGLVRPGLRSPEVAAVNLSLTFPEHLGGYSPSDEPTEGARTTKERETTLRKVNYPDHEGRCLRLALR